MPFYKLDYPAKREVKKSGNSVLDDIESHVDHIPNQYQDKSVVTASHEESHFLASSLRNQHAGMAGFYVLNNKAVLIREITNVKIADIAKAIPEELKGISYQLYLINSQRDWNNQPLYLADELSAYVNGSAAGAESTEDYGSELLQAYEFLLYCSVLSHISKNSDLASFQGYQLARVDKLYKNFRGNKSRIESYLSKWRNSDYALDLALPAYTVGNSEFL